MGYLYKNIFLISLYILVSYHPIDADIDEVHAFRNYTDTRLERMEILGKVISTGYVQHDFQQHRKILDYYTKERMLTVLMGEYQNIRIGDFIYIIEKENDHDRYKNGIIVAKAEVYSVFKTVLQGWLFKAKGNFSQVKAGHFAARLKVNEEHLDALVLLKKGDRASYLGQFSKAIAFYEKSLEKDINKPETYFQLAHVKDKLDIPESSFIYIKKAWERMKRFQDIDLFLKLPGKYLMYYNEAINDDHSRIISIKDCSYVSQEDRTKCYLLRDALLTLKEIRKYKQQLELFRHRLTPEALTLLKTKGIPDYEFQYQFGELLLKIHKYLKDHRPVKVLYWLQKEERKTLYEPLYMPYQKEKFTKPKKKWDEAYLEAAMYHFQIAHELDPLDGRSAYSILEICYEKIQNGIPTYKKDIYRSLALHYGKKIMNLSPKKGYNWPRIRFLLNSISQL